MADAAPQRVMVCRLFSARGERSAAIELRPDGCDVQLPEPEGNDYWLVFLPPRGFELAGPFYLWKEFQESEIAASPNRSIHIEYQDSELIPELWPHSEADAEAVRTILDEHVDRTRANLIRAKVEQMAWPTNTDEVEALVGS